MMSSEEDYDFQLLRDNDGAASVDTSSKCASYNNNNNNTSGGGGQKSKPSKRVRQRVDAGEPRNSYAAIPNFTSRPTNGYIVSSAGTKLISDLLARQRASSSSSNVSETNSMTVEMEGSARNGTGRHRGNPTSATSPGAIQGHGGQNPSTNAQGDICKSPLFINGNDESTSDLILNQDDLVDNSYLLRSILQERNNFSDAVGGVGGGRTSPGSSETDSEGADDDEEMMVSQEDSDGGGGEAKGSSPRPVRGRHRRDPVFGNTLGDPFLAVAAAAAAASSNSTGHGSENASTRCGNAPTLPTLASSVSAGALQSLPGPGVKEDRDEEEDEEGEENRNDGLGDKMSSVSRSQELRHRKATESLDSGSPGSSRSASPVSLRDRNGGGGHHGGESNNSTVQDLKRARVETIVSNMLHVPGALSSGRSPSTNGPSYPEPSVPVNGCKKRKLYQPQQHEASKSTKLNGRVDQYFNDDEEDLEDSELIDEVDDAQVEMTADSEGAAARLTPKDPGDDIPSAMSGDKKKRTDHGYIFKNQLSQVQRQVAVMEQRYRQLYEPSRVASSPAMSDDPHSVEDQIKRDCDVDMMGLSKTTASPGGGGQFAPGREANCLPNVYFVSTPKDKRSGSYRDNASGDETKVSSKKSEDRQSCIVKTSMASSSSPAESPQLGCQDLEWLVNSLKSELSSTLSGVIDSIVAKYAQRRSSAQKSGRTKEPPTTTETSTSSSNHHHHHHHQSHHHHHGQATNQADPAPAPLAAPAESRQPSSNSLKDFNTGILSQMLDRKSPRTKVIDRGNRANGPPSVSSAAQRTSPYLTDNSNKGPLYFPRNMKRSLGSFFCVSPNGSLPTLGRDCHSPPTPPTSLLTAAALGLTVHPHHNHQHLGHQAQIPAAQPSPASIPTSSSADLPEQTEAMSLVVPTKKKRHKVTDTRITPRTVSRLLGPEPEIPSKYHQLLGNMVNLQEQVAAYHHAASGGHPVLPPPPLVPVSLPTSVAIPNPSLHQSDVFNPFHFEAAAHRFAHFANNNNNNGHGSYLGGQLDQNSVEEDSLMHGGSPSLHSSMLGGPHGSPDSMNHYSGISGNFKQENGDGSDAGDSQTYDSGLNMMHTSTLTPMHLRKAKLMFFYVRYPSSAILKMYFPDIKFNKNNTAQLVKWFSNFREFYYIQMEKYARQAISDGVKNSEEIKVSMDAELIRVLNLHYNRNNHIEVPDNFRYVVEQTLREFYKALLAGKDAEQSWKKAIYKVIARLDDGVPEYFKSPNFLEQLE